MRHVGSLAWVFLSLVLSGCNAVEEAGPPAAASAVNVGFVVVKTEAVPYRIDLRGRVVASATAEVRPQVDGVVRAIGYVEGREVAAGDTLYEVDDRKFKASLAAAEAALHKAEAATASAQSTFDRNKALAETKAVSAQTVEDAQSTLLQAKATQEAASADVEMARIDLDNTTIRAPIGGMIGISAVSVGALVTANQTDALATIRQVDPVFVDLIDTSTNLLRIRDEIDAGVLERSRQGPTTTTLTLETGKAYDQDGKVSLADMVVGETTGTFMVRATFPNPERVLVPGMFVTATLQFGNLTNAVLVPQRALTRGDDGAATVYVASADAKARQTTVTTKGTIDNDWIVTEGLKAGDRLIVDGFQKISDGIAVNPVEVTIDEDGVVKQTLETSAAGTK